MKEQLKDKVQIIKNLLPHSTWSGADLLADLAYQYSAKGELEDEVIILKMEYQNATPEDQQQIIAQMQSLADRIVAQYDEEAIQKRNEKEQQLANFVKKQKEIPPIVLAAKSIEKTYRSTGFQLKLEQLELRRGEITGLVGENATGKSTLFRILAGELAMDKGKVSYPLFEEKAGGSWLKLKKQIAFVPQELPPWVGSLENNLRYKAALHDKIGKKNDKSFQYIIQRLGLATHQNKNWHQLSGGYKLRFALAKAMIWEPQLLILDEPLANLDIKTQVTVLNDLKDLSRSLRHPMSILISSQHIHELESIANQILFMKDGKVEHLGALSDLGMNRKNNLFEFNVPLTYTELTRQLQHFPYEKIWFNGISYMATTPIEWTGHQFLQHLIGQGVEVTYFRDISRSVKTKFYESDME